MKITDLLLFWVVLMLLGIGTVLSHIAATLDVLAGLK